MIEMIENERIPLVGRYKLKVNGFHIVATRNTIKKNRVQLKKDILSKIFDRAYERSLAKGLIGEEQVKFINSVMNELYKIEFQFADLFQVSDFEKDFTEYIENRLKQKVVNLIMRKKRFREKANLHCWNYFVTQTYDSSKYASEEEFKKAYLTCLSHLSTDLGWRYMGVWERGKVSGRLHFHGMFYIPKGKMKGFLKESKYFSPYSHKMEKSMINSFFAVRFGRNDFQSVKNDVSGISNYICKYINKTDDKIVYSRHIDDCVEIELSSEDFSIGYNTTYAQKYILFDSVVYNTILDFRRARGEPCFARVI